MALLVVLLIWGAFGALKFYTHHGESITVPDLRGMTIEQIDDLLSTRELRYTVVDSTFIPKQKPNVVVDQNPMPNAAVKESRRIYLTINAIKPPMVAMPEIIDASLRNARAQLEIMGLEVGELTYEDDLAHNAVLDMIVNGDTVKVGKKVAKGTKVDLVLGNGYGSSRVKMPDLTGQTLQEAKTTLVAYRLIVGEVIRDEDVSAYDQYALVYKQFPEFIEESETELTVGEPVDLHVRRNPNPPPPPPPPEEEEILPYEVEVVDPIPNPNPAAEPTENTPPPPTNIPPSPPAGEQDGNVRPRPRPIPTPSNPPPPNSNEGANQPPPPAARPPVPPPPPPKPTAPPPEFEQPASTPPPPAPKPKPNPTPAPPPVEEAPPPPAPKPSPPPPPVEEVQPEFEQPPAPQPSPPPPTPPSNDGDNQPKKVKSPVPKPLPGGGE